MSKQDIIADLSKKARLLRRHVIEMLGEAGSGHPGGSLSAADIVSVLFFKELQLKPNMPDWPERDRFVLSKGHAAPVLYAALAERGYFPVEELATLRRLGSRLQGHPDMLKLPGIEISTGSLGQGLSVANGIALAGKLDGASYRVYALLGDGETQEGQIWEAAMAAAHYSLNNLTIFIDYNRLQIDGPVSEVMAPEPMAAKWQAFGWNVLEIDGHSLEQIIDALDEARNFSRGPTAIVAHTVKGKGVSFMENGVDWHGATPKGEQLAQALKELA